MSQGKTIKITTLDGETREAQACPDGSWGCPFCSGANFPPGHEHHRDYGWPGPCMNPACIVGGNMTEDATRRYREAQERRERDERERKAREDAKRAEEEATEQRRKERNAALAAVRGEGIQLGFAWACVHEAPPPAYGEAPVSCAARGSDRSEYEAHMRGHGKRALAPTVKPVKLRKAIPGATFRKLEIPLAKWLRWTEGHTTQTDSGIYGTKRETQTAERRGQFWAEAGPHSVWVLPFDPAPWESGRPALVELHIAAPGKYTTQAWEASSERRAAKRAAERAA